MSAPAPEGLRQESEVFPVTVNWQFSKPARFLVTVSEDGSVKLEGIGGTRKIDWKGGEFDAPTNRKREDPNLNELGAGEDKP